MLGPATDRTFEELSLQVTRIMVMSQDDLEAAWGKHCRGKPPDSAGRQSG